MNIFNLHNQVIQDYRSYIESFIEIRDERIRDEVQRRLHEKHMWPDPLVQFNPAYAPAENFEELAASGLLHQDLVKYLRERRLYRHQAVALDLGARGRDFVVTSGTGSGKSLTFLATIFNAVMRDNLQGVCAVIIYPMNALINSQTEEIKKHAKRFAEVTGRPFPVTFAQYTGQEGEEKRKKILETRPHILLTNYMMMELIMTRSREASMREAIRDNLQFLVFDELHTYRGRQGADVAILNRRVREMASREVISIGTSATMASGHGTLAEQRQQVADVATALFGRKIASEQIINEELARQLSQDSHALERATLAAAIQQGSDGATEDNLAAHPLAVWLESDIGLEEKEREIVRGKPRTIPQIAERLHDACGLDQAQCEGAVRDLLATVERINESRAKKGQRAYLPFKLHQFIAQTGSVYVTLKARNAREITLDGGYYVVDDDGVSLPIFPVVFSRLSGCEFICVQLVDDETRLIPRDFYDQGVAADDDDETEPTENGYLLLDIDDEALWKDEYREYLPSTWFEQSKSGRVQLKKEYEERLPRRIWFDRRGKCSFDAGSAWEMQGWYVAAPLRIDPSTGTVYEWKTKEGTKLARLGSEARSTATSVLSQSIVKNLGSLEMPLDARKVLSFTDNRQDASLQSGHFNDFVRVIHFRSGIYRALAQPQDHTLTIAELPNAVVSAMALREEEYARYPSTDSRFHVAVNPARKALERLVLHRVLDDLRRGWRVTLPNLERCGLLRIGYDSLELHAANEVSWGDIPGFSSMEPDERIEVLRRILDYFRGHFALSHVDLDAGNLEQAENEIRDQLVSPWTIENDDRLRRPTHLALTRIQNRKVHTESLGFSTRLGRYLRSLDSLKEVLPDREEYGRVIGELLRAFTGVYLAATVVKDDSGQQHTVYRLLASAIRWRMGDGDTVDFDPVQFNAFKGQPALPPNVFFRELYRHGSAAGRLLVGKEHTAQLTTDDRIEREKEFREGAIQALFCSPTMELGIDIADLSIVHMRNVPPSPANYAQRGGRAGRSGQAALVFTYCSNGSPHDRHYFANATDMVSGVVKPPIIDLTNEELLRSHLYAMYIETVALDELERSLKEMIDFGDKDKLPLTAEVQMRLRLSTSARADVAARFARMIASMPAGWKCTWYSDEWIARVLEDAPAAFDRAIDRWRHLYRVARRQRDAAQAIVDDPTLKKTHQDKKNAEREERQARRQLSILLNEGGGSRTRSEFYPYSYLAAEGFLPGYNFTRLPMRVFLPVGDNGEFIDRARNVGLSEFGPYNQIYHNGSRYQTVRLQSIDLENSLIRAKVSKRSGYFLTGPEFDSEICPFTQETLQGSSNSDLLVDLVEMKDVFASPLAGITCEEEERTRRGFDVRTYFAVDHDQREVESLALMSEGNDLLTVKYIPTARLYLVNTKWRFYREKGFLLNMKTGMWLKSPLLPAAKSRTPEKVDASAYKKVMFYTSMTADALYIHPSDALPVDPQRATAALTTLQYALALAIERVFSVEPREISVQLMGDVGRPNIMIYESAQGSLGVLAQVVANPDRFREVVRAAFDVCRFNLDPADEAKLAPASYDDLLSYYNQRDHDKIDRRLIRDTLELLLNCDIEARGKQREAYDVHYARIWSLTDPNSELERRFIDDLYKRKLRLPDKAQVHVPDIYCRPDFFYDPNVYVFVDGSVHDDPKVAGQDQLKRRAMMNDGLRVIVYSYKDDIEEVFRKHKDIFKPIS